MDHEPTVEPAEDTSILINVNDDITGGADLVNLETGVAVTTPATKGTVVYNDDGTFTYTPTAGQTGPDSFVYTVTDGDGDPDPATVNILLDEDSKPEAFPDSATVDESDLPTIGSGLNPEDQGPPSVDQYSYTASGNLLDNDTWYEGTPDEATITSVESQTEVGGVITVDTPTGLLKVYVTDAAADAAKSGETAGYYEYTLEAATADGVNDSETFNYVLTDGDTGDTSPPAALTITILDDEPSDISPMTAFVVNSGDAIGNGALDFFGNVGADQSGDVVFTDIEDGVSTLPVTTQGGETVYLYGNETGVLTGWTQNPGGSQETKVFTITLHPDGTDESLDYYTVDFDVKLDDGSRDFSDFSLAPAGQSQWIGIDVDGNVIDVDHNDSTDLLITGLPTGNSVNTSNTDIGSGNQHVGTGEGLRLDFVQDVTYGPDPDNPGDFLDEKDPNGFEYDNHYTDDAFSCKLMQVQGGSSNTAAVKISIWDHDDTDHLDLLGNSTEVDSIDPNNISVNGELLAAGQFIIDDDGSLYIDGLYEGDVVFFKATTDFDSVHIENADGLTAIVDEVPYGDPLDGSSFDLGEFHLGEATLGDAVDLSFDLDVTDQDNDHSSGTLNITVVPEGVAVDASSETEGVALIGGSGDDTLTGGSGEDMITGGDGNDTIYADDGVVDIIDGGDGLDTAYVDLDDLIDNVEDVET